MPTRIAINGFGRIGRMAVRAGWKNPKLQFVAVNDLSDAPTNAHLLKYDTVHGIFDADVKVKGSTIIVGKHSMAVLAEKDPTKLPWAKLKVDVVLECTGRFTKRVEAAQHLKAGAKKVIISAPADDVDATIVLGVNDGELKKKTQIVSNASCTTNSLSPVAMVWRRHLALSAG
jgi:glyceraldehyde 3-phosphate dehydrogenase